MTAAPLRLGLLQPEDRVAWEPLARGYKAFYETEVDDAGYDAAWQRLTGGGAMLGLGAWLPATASDPPGQPERLVGIAHALFHASTWSARTSGPTCMSAVTVLAAIAGE